MNAPAPDPGIPPGFRPLKTGGDFMGINGPICVLHQGADVRFGLRGATSTPWACCTAA